MGPITKATVVLMALMLLCAIYNFLGQVERNHAAGIATVSALEILHRCAPLNEVISSIETLDDKLSSPIVLAGLEAFKTAPDGFAEAKPIELAKSAMDRREALAHLDARRPLILLDTVASVAPMLGMFATILALLGVFRANRNVEGAGSPRHRQHSQSRACAGCNRASRGGTHCSVLQLRITRNRKARRTKRRIGHGCRRDI